MVITVIHKFPCVKTFFVIQYILIKMAAKFSSAIVLSTILVMMGADPISPQQSSQGGNNIQPGANGSKIDSPIATNEKPSTDIGNDHKQQPILVNVEKDGWDYALIIFTILFTGGLVWVGARQIVWMKRTQDATKKAADAAAKNADTLVRQNSPYLRFSTFALAAENPPVVRYILRNYGGGRAFLKEMCIKLHLTTETLPPDPQYEGVLHFPFFGVTLGTMDPTLPINEKFPQEIKTIADVRNTLLTQHLFIYGFVVYLDVLAQKHTFGFAYEYVNERFIEAGGIAYNYRRCEKEPDNDPIQPN